MTELIDSKIDISNLESLTISRLKTKIEAFNLNRKRRKPLNIEIIPINIWKNKYRKLGCIHTITLETIANESKNYIETLHSEKFSTILFNTLLARKPRPDKVMINIYRITDSQLDLFSSDHLDIMIRLILPKRESAN